ncbi:MCE family protein [Mycobacterium sp. ACS4331]|uniref:MCE family protein n=1 Tax=Mycobacterium sp. ACS4331 TaxID=1834121 RepID=UPI0007FFD911|nr:MCE family protein [Mycobacterium sp. ACS4331]OBF20398.1 MCE-family protein [Mycobacterium sp. ACS4331]
MTRHLGPGPIHRSETASAASPLAASAGRHFGVASLARPVTGVSTVLLVAATVAVAVGLFNGSFSSTVPLTVISERSGLVMNPDAKVKMRGVQVGTVSSIEYRPDGTAALHLAIKPAELRNIPENVVVDIASSTVFGAKYVQLSPPSETPPAEPVRPGQELVGQNVTVETNTVFEQLTRILDSLEPTKVNAILSTLSRAASGRGAQMGQTLSDLNAAMATLEPGLPNLSRDIDMLPATLGAYADAAPDLMHALDNATVMSRTLVAQQDDLDALLIGAIGLAHIGDDVLTTNGGPLRDVVHLLVPTTDMLSRNEELLGCTLKGMVPLTKGPPLPEPGVYTLAGLKPGIERYRYPRHLPKVNATAKPGLCQLLGLPLLKPQEVPPFVVTDVGANPWEYGNQGILLNSDGLKQALFGPVDGPPRNGAQIGMPG